ncbi:hypothetical protein [Pinirhizobacter soli]|uniref:hypothetical protein n=1 Tax=Pinirhizobacter soli TaxID=2786953 RepID=UPI00202A3F88|nr:hypothetical protein [Pinirhizobacter soli]
MLRAIPSSALACCVDGVRIPASAMHGAHTAARLGDYARRRAATVVAQAHAEAETLRRRAAEDAYREARIQGARVLLGAIDDIARLRSSLLEGVMVQARQHLRDHCAAAGFTEAWVERACQIATDGKASASPRVQVPMSDDGIFLALRAALDDTVAVEQADVPCLRVEQGDLVLEYDPEHVVFDAALQPPAPDMQALYDGLAAIASRYADAIVGPGLPSP